MYNEQKNKMIKEFTKMFFVDLILTLTLAGIYDFSVLDSLLGMFLVSCTLLSAYWYTVATKRPILFVMLLVFYLGLSLYSRSYLEAAYGLAGILGYIFRPGTSTIVLLGCFSAIILEIKEIIGVIKKRVDIWIPPLWSLVVAVYLILEFDPSVHFSLKRIRILLLVAGLIIVCFYKNNSKPREDIYYDVSLRGYFPHLVVLCLLVLIGSSVLPVVEYLPGAKWLQQHNNVLIKDLPTEVSLIRNPLQSDQILFEVNSMEPLYLREIAYSHYENGNWRIEKGNNEFIQLDQEELKEESAALRMLLGEKVDESFSMHQAYIYELKNYEHYLTTNGIREIHTNKNNNIVYYGNLNNICFEERKTSGQVGYTITYEKIDSKIMRILRESRLLGNREKWKNLINGYLLLNDLSDNRYFLSDEEYSGLEEIYTQVPENMRYKLRGLAEDITYYDSNDVAKAEAIEAFLKDDEYFSYEYGASYQDLTVDPVYDFLFNKRTGICQDFASSMVLLCRSIDLPARYVTGYYSEESSAPGKYIIRAKHGHAFVEVYISGYGWMLFDPTPRSTTENKEGIQDRDNEWETNKIDGNSGFIGRELFGAIFALMVSIMTVRFIGYLIWRTRLFNKPTYLALDELLKKSLMVLETKDYGLQEGETLQQLTKRLEQQNIDISPITKPWNEYFYGNKEITKWQVQRAFKCYHKLKRVSSRKNRVQQKRDRWK